MKKSKFKLKLHSSRDIIFNTVAMGAEVVSKWEWEEKKKFEWTKLHEKGKTDFD